MNEIHAVIGVQIKGKRALYVKRSSKMQNYPETWSLFSIQFEPEALPDPEDLEQATSIMKKMCQERLGGANVEVIRFLRSDSSDHNPMQTTVNLHLYEISLPSEFGLNEEFYTDRRWMTCEEYEIMSEDRICGLCVKMWQDVAFLNGICSRPYSANLKDDGTRHELGRYTK